MQVYSCTLLNHLNGAINSYVSVQHHLPTYGPQTAYGSWRFRFFFLGGGGVLWGGIS
jgi:hypothetical protein